MNINLKTNVQQIIEIFDHDTNEKKYYLEKNNKWIQITKHKYNKILEANNE